MPGVNLVTGDDGSNNLLGGAGADLIYGFNPNGPQGDVTSIAATRVASGLSQPLFAAAPPGDFGRLFIVEKTGDIKILNLGTGQVEATPFLDVSSQIYTASESGLLGLAFDPDFANNGFFYVNMIANTGGQVHTEIRRYQVSATNPNVADPASATPIISINQPFDNHKGGWLGFGSDGDLYAALGDGGSGGDPFGNAQNVDSLLGKMLRLNVHGDDFPGDPARNYRIPTDNPFVGIAGADEIWALGLRNPWRPSFDRGLHDLYIADVGQNRWEEIDLGQLGANYGWNVYEGPEIYAGGTPSAGTLTAPIYSYDHSVGNSITGGYVYRGPSEGLQGQYFFGDFIAGTISTLHFNGTAWVATDRTAQIHPDVGAINNPSSFGEDAQGNLYVVDFDGDVFRLTPIVTSADQSDNLDGQGGDDMLFGGSGNDTVTGGTGNDTLNGGAGIDSAVFSGNRSAYTITATANGVQVSGTDGTDTLTGIERLVFDDTTVALPRADFNGSFTSDILWRNDNGEAYIWEMNGLQIKAQGSIATAETFWHIAGTGDFDSDGKSDILWRNDNGEAYIWEMNGLQIKAQGSIATAETFWHIAGTGDFDSDGKSDILWRNDNGEAYIWEMNGLQIKAQGSIATAETFWHIAGTGDFDSDGKSDILWRNDNGEAYIWEMNGLQIKAQGSIATAETFWHIENTGDFDSDGKSDILWRNDNGQAYIWEMNGLQIKAQGSIATAETFWHIAGTGDSDSDGKSDILWRNDNGEAYIWGMNGLQIKAQGSIATADTHWHIQNAGASDSDQIIPLGNFDGDGRSDILWRNDNGEAFIWEMNGLQAKAQGSLGIVDTRWHIASTGDFDGDGRSDILWRNDNGEAFIWEMNGLQAKAQGSLGIVDTRWHIASTGDFDGDGKSDILWRNDNGEAFIWEMNGLQAKAQASLGIVDTRWHIASTGDFDGDGKSDILWRNDNGEAFIWEMNGLQAKAQGSLGGVDTRWHIQTTGDFDGDGKSDILWRNDNGEAFIWEMNGLQAKAQGSLGIVDTRWHIASTGDVDGDGKSDILWRNDNGEAFIWEMNGLQVKAQASLGGVDTRWHIAGHHDLG